MVRQVLAGKAQQELAHAFAADGEVDRCLPWAGREVVVPVETERLEHLRVSGPTVRLFDNIKERVGCLCSKKPVEAKRVDPLHGSGW